MAIIVTGPSQQEHMAPVRWASGRRARPAVAAVVALTVLGVLTVNRSRAAAPAGDPSLAIPPLVATTPIDPSYTGRWMETGLAAGKLTWIARSSTGYVLPTDDGIVTITDDDDAVQISLPDLVTVGGITADESRVVVYGRSATGPALWESPDGLTWTLERLPWQGVIRTVTFDEGRLLLFGITRGSDGLTGTIAHEASGSGWELTPSPIPASRVTAIPGAFVIRERTPDGAGHRYYATRDMVVHEPFADRFLISSVGLAAGVIDTAGGPRLVAPTLGVIVDPPDWPVVGLWQEDTRIWLQTATSLWTSLDGERWDDIPLDRTVWSGVALALPVGDGARVLVTEGTGLLRIFRWQPDEA